MRPLLASGLFLAAAALLPAASEIGRPLLQNFSPRVYHRAAQNWVAAQDAAGVLYFGNNPEVLAFDGAAWTPLAVAPHGSTPSAIVPTPDGRIYVGGYDEIGYLQPAPGGPQFVSLLEKLPQAQRNFRLIGQGTAHEGAVVFTTDDDVLLWRDEKFSVLHLPHARLLPSHGELYVIAPNGPLQRLHGGRLEPVSDSPALRAGEVRFLATRADGSLLVAFAKGGLFRVGPDSLTPFPTEGDEPLRTRELRLGLQLPDGSLAFVFKPSGGGGVMLLGPEGNFLAWYNEAAGLQNQNPLNLFSDREGALWLCLNSGVSRIERPLAASAYDSLNGLGHSSVLDILRYKDTLYVAALDGLYRLVPGQAMGPAAHFERIVAGEIWSLQPADDGLLAASTRDLYLVNGGTAVSTLKLDAVGYILLRSRVDPRRYWIGHFKGLQAIYRTDGGWRDDGMVPNFDPNVLSLAESDDGALWAGTRNQGVFRFAPSAAGVAVGPADKFERFAGGLGLPEISRQSGVTAWAGQAVIAPSHSRQMYRFVSAAHRFEPLPALAPLPEESIVSTSPRLGAAYADHLWLDLSTAHGGTTVDDVVRVTPEGRREVLTHALSDVTGYVNVLYEEDTAAGRVLWIGGDDGVLRLDVARAFAQPVAYPVAVHAPGFTPGAARPYSKAALDFEYIAPHYPAGNPMVYRTRLAGYESDWSAWSGDRKRTFTNLPGGDYRFEVQARDFDGFESPPAAVAFSVLPPWWLSWWGRGIFVVLGLGVVAALIRLRTSALHRRAVQLEGVIADRTAELAKKNVELGRLLQLELDEKVSARLAEERARLQMLRYQLNPHFLFNTLASISAAIPPGRSPARIMVDRLVEFCRLTLHRPDDTDWTTLAEELKLLRSYLEIEQARWEDLLEVTIEVEPGAESVRLPHFLLLPILENALKYGRATSPERVGIRLAASREGDMLVIEVANTGEWIPPSEKKRIASLGVGLENLRERLARYYPRAHEFAMTPSPGWVTVTLRLKIAGLSAAVHAGGVAQVI